MGKKMSEEEIIIEYEELKNVLKNLNDRLIDAIERLLEEKEIKLGFPIKGRIKELDSLIDKHKRGAFRINKTIKEVQDLVGFRIILLFKRDVIKVTQVIEENLSIKRKYDTQDRLGHDQFGYSSIHCIVSVPDSWLEVPIYKDFSNLIAEIQIRTLSQHNWAEFSQIIDYKEGEEIPKSIKRSMGRVSALLETVDLEFERLLDEKINYETGIKSATANETLDEEIIEKLLDHHLPNKYKMGNEVYSKGIVGLKEHNIILADNLITIIKKNLDGAMELDRGIVNAIVANNGKDNQITINGINYSTAGLKEIKKNKTFFNQIGLLGQIIKQNLK